MIEAPFTYPTIYWLIPLPLCVLFLCLLRFRNVQIAFIAGAITLFISWVMYGSLLHSHMENWLAGQRVYAIIFKDFPKDREGFIAEYIAAFKAGGTSAVARRQEATKLTLMSRYVKHYISETPTETLGKYILSEAWLLSALSQKDQKLCKTYLANYEHYDQVRQLVGDDIFLPALQNYPDMIVQAVDNPEPVTTDERLMAPVLYSALGNRMRLPAGRLNLKTLPCNIVYAEFFLLSKSPPKEAALIVKYIYSEDHLKVAKPRAALPSKANARGAK